MQVLCQVRKIGLAAVIAAFVYQPAMQANADRFLPSSPTAPSIDTLVATASENVANRSTAGAKQSMAGAPFVGVAHPTSGQAQVVEENGQRYLAFDSAFRSDAGPDLFVLLHTAAVPESYAPQDYVNLGRLQATEGTQRYAIPADVNIDDLRSAVIWCQEFNVTFGYATL
ncbi:MAG: DM13 domain-containing protein [Phormidesmis sp.]